MHDNSHKIDFHPTGESLAKSPFLQRANEEHVRFTPEVSGILNTQHSAHASIEFIFEDKSVAREEQLGSSYRGEGVYLLRGILDAREQEGNNTVPFWVVVKQRECTIAKVRTILEHIERIVDSGEFVQGAYWPLP